MTEDVSSEGVLSPVLDIEVIPPVVTPASGIFGFAEKKIPQSGICPVPCAFHQCASSVCF